MSTGGDPKSSTTLIAGLIGAIGLLVIVVAAQVLFYNVQRHEDERKLYAVKPRELADLQAAQLAQINGYRYVDRQKGAVAIPIDDAIRLYVGEMKSAPPVTTMPETTDAEPVPAVESTP
jgi:hypothetical protein